MKKRNFYATTIATLMLIGIIPISAQNTKSPTTRQMNLITWTEFQEWVPDKIETVLLPTGSIEPHGVIPNGTDNLAPQAMAIEIAERLNALIAPTLNYGVTPAMQAYPGAISISQAAYGPFIESILTCLAGNKFKNIIILNGHGGNTSFLQKAAVKISNQQHVRILVINWWSLTSAETLEFFGEDAGHAGNNETAYIQAIVPKHIHPERYDKDMATPNATGSSWYAVPVPSSIGLYKQGQGYPTFDPKQAQEYFHKVNNKVAALIADIIQKWDKAKLYR